MAKRATQRPTAQAAAKQAAAASGTVPNATLPLAEVPTPSAEPPAEVFGVSPPQAPLSDGAESDADADAPEIIVGSEPEPTKEQEPSAPEPETTVLNTLEAGASAGQVSAALAEQQSAEIVTPPAVQPPDSEQKNEQPAPSIQPEPLHPTIEAAKRYQTGHGKPIDGHPKYYTPKPPDLRTKAQRERDEKRRATDEDE